MSLWIQRTQITTLLLTLAVLSGSAIRGNECHAGDINVLVWDERQPSQKEAYPEFIGGAISKHLSTLESIEVRSRSIDDPDQGISEADLEWANVLIWWGHVRQHELKPKVVQEWIVSRIQNGDLCLIALHSAHWSTPFVEAMNARTKQDVLKLYPPERSKFTYIDPPGRLPPTHESILTPAIYALKSSPNSYQVRIDLPNCCFPDYRPDGAPSTIEVLKQDHPIAQGLGKSFQVQHTEMYNEPFHVPAPDDVIFKETWSRGEWFRAGMLWTLGKGTIFYFRPGHETFPVYLQKEPLLVIENAVRFLGKDPKESE